MRFWMIAALIAAAANVAAQPLPTRAYSVADGLVHDRVKRVVADSRGLLWFCTPEGLGRFDGTRFTTYKATDGLPFDSVNDLLETRAGDYWLATNGGGVARVSETTTFAAVSVGDSAATNRVNVLHEDTDRRVWAGTDAGLFVMEPGATEFRHVPLATPLTVANEPQVWAIAHTKTHGLVIGTGAGLVAQLPDGTLRTLDIAGQPRRSVTALLAIDESVWIGHATGVALLSPSHNNAESIVTTTDAVLALAQRGRHVWAGTLTGELLTVDAASRIVTERHADVARTGILSLTVDRGNGLWIGTRAEGSLRLLGTALVPFAEREGLPPLPVRVISESRRGDIYVLSLRSSRPLFVLEDSRFVEVPIPAAAGAVAQVVQQDRRGRWWIGSGQGLARFADAPSAAALRDATPTVTYTTRNGLPSGSILTLFEDSAERMWIGASGTGHVTYVDSARAALRDFDTGSVGLPLLQPNTFVEDHAANVWIGGRNGELARYRGSTLEAVATPRPLRQVAGMLVDRAGRVWVASAAGLYRIDTPSAERPELIEITGLSSTMTRFVVEDPLGRLYIGLPSGVNRLDPNTGVIELYTPADGLRGFELTTSLRDRNGNLWFGTHNGVTRLSPLPETIELPAGHAYINTVRVAGVDRPASLSGSRSVGPLALDWTQNNIAIDYFAVTFRAGETLAFRYRLEGADTTWSAPTPATTVTYASLPPGEYRFAVEPVSARTDRIDETVTPATVSFVIEAPLWRRSWFLALAGSLLMAGAWLAYRARLARLLEVERLRIRIATDLHDDIGANLSRISILSEVASQRFAEHPAERQMLSTIADTSRSMLDAMSDIVWTISPDRDSIHDLSQRMREFASDQLETRGIDFTFSTPPASLQQILTLTMRRELLLIFKEAITNSARHSGATAVRSTLSVDGGNIRLEVIDNGRGFTPDLVSQGDDGNGLGNMARRAQALRGDLAIDASPERGTSIVLTAPLRS